ncbi:MAG: hypothetical protein HYY52_06045 [Candidatus Melainabacteria bacterium]|nr:hypothetical protein [Candidatus Melainabacteria bacterium]
MNESMSYFPGIIFTNSPTGRRASVSGTGLDVWELIMIYKNYNKNVRKILEAYPITQSQLNSALSYYSKYKDEINEEIKENEDLETLLSSPKEFPWIKRIRV